MNRRAFFQSLAANNLSVVLTTQGIEIWLLGGPAIGAGKRPVKMYPERTCSGATAKIEKSLI